MAMAAPNYSLANQDCPSCGAVNSVEHKAEVGRFECAKCCYIVGERVTDLSAGVGGGRERDARPDDTRQHTVDLDKNNLSVGGRQTGFNPWGRDKELREGVAAASTVTEAYPDDVLGRAFDQAKVPRDQYFARASTLLHELWDRNEEIRTGGMKQALCLAVLHFTVLDQDPSLAAEVDRSASKTERENYRMMCRNLEPVIATRGRIVSTDVHRLAVRIREKYGRLPWLREMAINIGDMIVFGALRESGAAAAHKHMSVAAAALMISICALESFELSRAGPEVVPRNGPSSRAVTLDTLSAEVTRPILDTVGLSNMETIRTIDQHFQKARAETLQKIAAAVQKMAPPQQAFAPSQVFAAPGAAAVPSYGHSYADTAGLDAQTIQDEALADAKVLYYCASVECQQAGQRGTMEFSVSDWIDAKIQLACYRCRMRSFWKPPRAVRLDTLREIPTD